MQFTNRLAVSTKTQEECAGKVYNKAMSFHRAIARIPWLVAAMAACASAASSGPDVLFLNSYHPGLGWSDQILEGVRKSMGPHEQLAVEYLDSKHFESRELDSAFASEFTFKYADNQPRVVFASDDYALGFLLQWRDSLFPGVPVVFCGINDFHPSMLHGRRGYTGISQWNRILETATLIMRLFPDTRDVWVVTEASATGTGNRRRLDSLARSIRSGMRFHFLDSSGTPRWSEIESKVASLGPGDVVYWSELFLDRDGLFIDPEVDLGALVERSKVPFFTHQAAYLSAGILGGDCNRGVEHGIQAGAMLRKVLDGVPVDSIPVEEDASTAPTFRWDAMRRFGVDIDRLPTGSIVLGMPVPVWKAYPVQTLAALTGIVLLAAMAGGLLVALRRARRSREEVRASEAALRRMFDAIPDAVFVHDDDGRVEFLNAGGCRMYDIDPAEAVRIGIQDLSAESSLDGTDFRALCAKAGQEDKVVFEWRALKPRSREEFDVEVSLTAMRFQGRRRIVAVVRDVTERVLARKVLENAKDDLERKVAERTQELVQANRELEAFSYSVSHDLRTPLRALDGFAKALEEDLVGELQDEHKDYLRRIQAASLRMGSIIDDLLHLSRISMCPLERVPVDMNDIVRQILPDYPETAFKVDWQVGKLPGAMADPALLKPLWTNLISNAVKYSAQSATPRIEIGSRVASSGLEWFIKDNGAGFEPSRAHNLFKPFRRLHGPEEFSGSGIGLAIAHRIVSRHGGMIWAEGEVGKGAAFHFTLG